MGMIAMGLRIKAKITVGDQAGKLLEATQIINKFGGVVDYMRHTRNVNIDWDQTILTLEAQMSCNRATVAVKEALKA